MNLMKHWQRSTYYILIFINISHLNQPILIAKPYPFNRSESSHIECFSNDQSIILSLTILLTIFDKYFNHSFLQYTKYNITKNESIIFNISSPFNYSQLDSQIECQSKYYHGEQKISQLNVFSVAEIPEKEFLIINTNTKQMMIIYCPIYGSNVSVQWNFARNFSKIFIDPLPIGTHLDYRSTRNDTLIIDHVSYVDHHGYYQCSASNRLFNKNFQDHTVYYLNVKKKNFSTFIIIACLAIGICILILILSSKYCRRMKQVC